MTTKSLIDQTTLPIIAAPMFLVSGTKLVIEACKNGIIGTFPSLNGRSSEDFEQMLKDITQSLAAFEKETGQKPAPYGVNLIVNKTNPRLLADLQLCVQYKVPLIITSLGAVKEIVDAVHSYGGLVFHDIIKKRHAEKAAEAGVDGIICVSAGAGGHAGTSHPFALMQEVKSFFKGTIVMAGSINTGQEVLAAQIAGADLAYMGTRMIATTESLASEAYKQMIIDAQIDDVIYTDGVSGVPANFLKLSVEKAELDLTVKKEEDFSKLTGEDSKAWKDIWSAGHGVSGIQDIPTVKILVDRIKEEYVLGLEKMEMMKEKFNKG